MRLRWRQLVPFILLVVLMMPLPAAALEILELSGGTITFDDHFFGRLAVQGPRLAITSSFQAVLGGSSVPGFKTCNGLPIHCTPGATLPVGGTWSGGDFHGPSSVTLDGIAHTQLGLALPFSDQLVLTLTGTVLIPDFGNIASVVLTAPFQLDGLLTRFNEPPFPNMVPDITEYELRGQGEFLLALHRTKPTGADAWQWDSMTFDLQPIPEPATLLLWGTGAAGLGVARWLKRRRAHEHAGKDALA